MCIVEQQNKKREKEINGGDAPQNPAYDVKKSYQDSLSYDAKAREVTNQLIEKVNGVALSREAQQHYGKLLKDEAANYEELQQPAQENLMVAQADQETKKQRKARVRLEEKYHSKRKVFGEGVSLRTQSMLDDRKEFKAHERKELNKVYDALTEKQKLEYLLEHINISDFSADMFEPKPGFVKPILMCLDKLNKFAVLRRLSQVKDDAADESVKACKQAFAELDEAQQKKVTKIVDLYNSFVTAAYKVLGENAINWKGKLDVEMARKDSRIENRRLVEFEKKIDATRHSQETEEAMAKFHEELSRLQKDTRQDVSDNVAAQDAAKIEENAAKYKDDVTKKCEESIRYFKNKVSSFLGGREKEACLGSLSAELESLMQEQNKTDVDLEGISRTIADLENQKKENLRTKSKHNPTKYDTDKDLENRLAALKTYESYVSGSVDHFMRTKRIARLQRMIRGICDDRPMTMSMKLELADRYHLKEYELKLEDVEENNHAKYHFDNRDYTNHADLKIKDFTVDENLEKEADRMENMMGEMSMEEFKKAKGKAYVKKYFRTFAYMESEKYLARKQNQRKFAQYLQQKFLAEKGSISLKNEEQEIKDRSQEAKRKNQLARLYGIEDTKTGLEAVKDTAGTIQTVMDVGVILTDVSTTLSGVADTTQQIITNFEFAATGPFTAITSLCTTVKSLCAVFENGKYSKNASEESAKLQQSMEEIIAGRKELTAAEVKQIEGLQRMLVMMKNAVKLGKVEVVNNLAKSIKAACCVASNTLGTLLIATNAIAKLAVNVVATGVTTAAEHGKKALRKQYVKDRFEKMFKAVNDENTALEAGFDGLSKRDIKHGLLRFLGAKTGKFSEAHALTAKADAEYLQDLTGDAQMAEQKKEILKIMGLTEKSKVQKVMLKLGADEGAAEDATAYIHKYRVLDASRKETVRQSRFKSFVRKTVKFMTCGDGSLNNKIGGIFSSNSQSDFWYDVKATFL